MAGLQVEGGVDSGGLSRGHAVLGSWGNSASNMYARYLSPDPLGPVGNDLPVGAPRGITMKKILYLTFAVLMLGVLTPELTAQC